MEIGRYPSIASAAAHPRDVLIATLRRRFRRSEAMLILLALLVGLIAGLFTIIQSDIAYSMQVILYGLDPGDRLSAVGSISTLRLLALPFGGLLLASFAYLTRRRARAPIDVVEANALHGGAIPARDTLLVSAQTIISNGTGASVGLEAAYAQMGGGLASLVGQWLRLRRPDLRILVGAGAGAAVGAAFGAPLTGAFYAFEIVIGAYTPAAIAPVAAAAIAAATLVRTTGQQPYVIVLPTAHAITTIDYFLYAALGLICAVVGIGLMRAITLFELAVRRIRVPDLLRPVIGGCLLVPIGWASPQALSAGHGALHLDLETQVGIGFLLTIFMLKMAASAVSLGFGFRGGLFFASLFLGSLAGQLFAELLALIPGTEQVSASDAALIGMAAMAVSIVGGPMTMSMLVLESTHDFALTGAAIAAALCASTLVRETFGFSFSTWRLHTRGETIRSARDVGWVKSLTAGRLMRAAQTIPAAATIAEFRRRFPLGTSGIVALTSADDGYAGLAPIAAAYADELEPGTPVSSIATLVDCAVRPEQDASSLMQALERNEADELAVIDDEGHVIGIVSERYLRRRYIAEIEKAQRELFGE